MRFTARWSPEEAEILEAKIWLEDASNTVLRFFLPENSLKAWQKGLQKLPEQEQLNLESALALSKVSFFYPPVGAATQSVTDVNPGALLELLAFCKFILAWKRLKSQSPVSMLSFLGNTSMVHLRLLWPYNWLFLEMDREGDGDNTSLLRKLKLWYSEHLNQALEQGRDKKGIILDHFLPNLDLFHAVGAERCREEPARAQTIRRASAALMLAFSDFIDGAESARSFDFDEMVRLGDCRPRLWAWLAENEALSLSERQSFVNRLFSADIGEATRRPLLTGIIEDLIEESSSDPESRHKMETIASFIAQNYLQSYMLDDALRIWQKVQCVRQDTLLRIILGWYRVPHVYGLLTLLLLWLLSTGFLPDWGRVVIGLIGLLLFQSLALFLLVFVAWRFLQRRGFSSIELFLPRLAGAVLVGLSILALENTIWEVSAQLPVLSSSFVSIAAYLGALTYIFLDVHKTTRLLEIEENTPTNNAENLASQSTPRAQRKFWVFSMAHMANLGRRFKNNSQISSFMARSVSTSWRVFAIGAAEALGLTTLVSSLLLLPEELFTRCSVFWQGAGLRIVQGFEPWGLVLYGPGIRLTFAPKIIILWAGLALLLGAFAQLLWQDRQITAS